MLIDKPHTNANLTSTKHTSHILKNINWKIFSILLITGLLGVIAILPLSLEISLILAKTLELPLNNTPPVAAIVLIGLMQNGIFLAIAIAIGLILAPRLDLKTPILDRYFAKARIIKPKNILFPALLTGLGMGVLMVTLDKLLFSYQNIQTVFSAIPLWKRLLAGIFYGGITSEIICRLFMFAVFVWILSWWWKNPNGKPSKAAYWLGNAIAALIFAILHLPTITLLTPLTAAVTLRIVLLNTIAGIICGYLYWKKGLESAMVSHASTHLILQLFI
ncbi:MAG: type II CAAX prenyl endopeptidase Rce1 family protein [Prochloraceae cyanobacterium]